MATKAKKAKKSVKRSVKQAKAARPRGAAAIRTVEGDPVTAPVSDEPAECGSGEPEESVAPKAELSVASCRLSAKLVRQLKTALGDGPSLLDAAAAVLKLVGLPMRARAITDELSRTGLWVSPAGKTPDATLAAAILTEIKKKGADSRFVKSGTGLFGAA
jgi:hypothetical protein